MNKPANIPFGLKPINEELLLHFQALDKNQLQWLSGYCAGLADSEQNPSESIELPAAQQLKTVILYGSQTGNSESLAVKLQAKIADLPLHLSLKSMDEVKAKDLKGFDIILIAVSTHGEGEAPDDAIELLESLQNKRAPKLESSQHAVLGLGDSSYEFFCQTGKDFDSKLIELGSKPIIERLDADIDFESDAALWLDKIEIKLRALSQSDLSSQSQSLNSTSVLQQAHLAQTYTKSEPLTATIITNQKLTGKGSSKSVHHIELSLEGNHFPYLPGDGVGIWVKNHPLLVSSVLQALGLSGSETVSLKGSTLSLSNALTEKLEITQLNPKTLKSLLAQVSEKSDLVIPKELEKTEQSFIKDNQLIDVLQLIDEHLNLSAQNLVDLLMPIKPRVYSIASSLKANPDEIHITVGLKETINERGKRKGAASQFLIETVEEGDEVFIYLEENKRFKLPEDDKPIILIGPGTGIAPFRSFLQEREENEAIGKSWLFFGNPNFNTDFLYQTELQKLLRDQILNKLDVAFSRDQVEKIYVQDKLKEHASQIWDWIHKESAYLYVCGDMSNMAKDVEKSLLSIIQEQGGFDSENAIDYLKTLKSESRYQRDVY